MTITKLHYALWDNLDSFDLGDSGQCPGSGMEVKLCI